MESVELTGDPTEAEVFIFYMLTVGRALLVDKRRQGQIEPWAEVFPQQELLLEGAEVEPPLTPQIVYLIERRRTMPDDRRIVRSYFEQLLGHLAMSLRILRPDLPLVRKVGIAPHFGPVVPMVASDAWRSLLEQLRGRGEQDVADLVKGKLREVIAVEVLRSSRFEAGEIQQLRADLLRQQIYRPLEL